MTYFDTENNPLYFKDVWTCFYKKKELGVPIHVKDLTLVR